MSSENSKRKKLLKWFLEIVFSQPGTYRLNKDVVLIIAKDSISIHYLLAPHHDQEFYRGTDPADKLLNEGEDDGNPQI